jgi:hypothetical protein
MSLYGGLVSGVGQAKSVIETNREDPAKAKVDQPKETKAAASSSSASNAPPLMFVPRPKPPPKRNSRILPVVASSAAPIVINSSKASSEEVLKKPTVEEDFVFDDVLDEYDPFVPNEIEQVLKRREQEKRSRENEAFVQKLRMKSREQSEPQLFVNETAEEAYQRRMRMAESEQNHFQDYDQGFREEEEYLSSIICVEMLEDDPNLKRRVRASLDSAIGNDTVQECIIYDASANPAASSPLFVFVRFSSTTEAQSGMYLVPLLF